MVGEAAKLAAESAKMTAESMVREMRERFDRQDSSTLIWREKMMTEIVGQNRTFDAFKSDFEDRAEKMDRRCGEHHEAIYGNREKNLVGAIVKIDKHDGWIDRLVWTWGIILAVGAGLAWYITYFYGDAMKRGIFNPTDEEWRWRVTKEVRKTVKPDSLYSPAAAPTPGQP